MQKAPGTGELITFGVNASKPFMELGVVSADGEKLLHKVDLNLDRCSLCHDIGITERYNVILDFPLTMDIDRLIKGGSLIKYNKEDYARIGVMPRYGDTDSVQWFEVLPNCTFHILNCFEHGDEVVVWGCRSLESIIPGPEMGENKFEWFSRRFRNAEPSNDDESLFTCLYEWRLNLQTGDVKEKNLTGTEASMDFPMIHPRFTGLENKFGYTQTIDPEASSSSGMTKYGGLAKLYFQDPQSNCDSIKVEYHKLETNTFCTGAAFVPKFAEGSCYEQDEEEDDGWIISFVHNEVTDISQVYIIDAKKFSSEPVAKVRLPCRVPYGFHGAFMPMPISVLSPM
ncbi:Carotenoid 9,10(9',10')-cleavage dioxygenase 1 [Linum perenne]